MPAQGAAPSTEDTILDNALAQDAGGNDGGSTTDTSGTTQGGTGGTTGQSGTPASQPAGGNQGAQPGGQQQQRQTPPTQAPPRNPGDLVDRRGNVLASAGAERRVFEKAHKYVEAEFKQHVSSLEAQVTALEGANTGWQTLGLTAQEAQTGAQLMAAFKKNPVDVVKYLLTEAQKSGHSIEGVGGSANIDAFASLLDERLGPLTANHEAQVQQQQIRQEVEQEYTSFMGRYPDAVTHEDDIAALLKEDNDLSPEVAYLKLQAFAFRNGLDWTKPLGAQVQARIATAKGGTQQPQRTGMPSGRSVNGAAPMANGTVAHEATPTRDIVRNAMLAAGYKFA